MIIKVLGRDQESSQALATAVRQAIHDLMLHATIEEITDPRAIAGFGVRSTPALVVDDKVLLSGRLPTAAEVQALLAVAPAS